MEFQVHEARPNKRNGSRAKYSELWVALLKAASEGGSVSVPETADGLLDRDMRALYYGLSARAKKDGVSFRSAVMDGRRHFWIEREGEAR